MSILRTALYCRLSKDDDMAQGDSESIKTQKAMLTQYAKEHGFMVVEIYVDDGWSGLNFDRPDFNRMLDDIEAGRIDVVITKDLSRLGRDHLKVGHFTEIYFPMKNVRYIAVNDCVDTANRNNDIAALKNVMNEFYSRDNSRKIRSSIRARAKAVLYRCSYAPFGYRKAPDNHNRLIIDEETAPIVKRIFELAGAGMGRTKSQSSFGRNRQPPPPGGSTPVGRRTIPNASPIQRTNTNGRIPLSAISSKTPSISVTLLCARKKLFSRSGNTGIYQRKNRYGWTTPTSRLSRRRILTMQTLRF